MLRNLSILLVLIVVAGIGISFIVSDEIYLPKPSHFDDEVTEQFQFKAVQKPVVLSSDASFPTPVIQLQQTVAHGLIEAERTELPLLKGELAEFSQNNIHENYPSPPELDDLRRRLKNLQSFSR